MSDLVLVPVGRAGAGIPLKSFLTLGRFGVCYPLFTRSRLTHPALIAGVTLLASLNPHGWSQLLTPCTLPLSRPPDLNLPDQQTISRQHFELHTHNGSTSIRALGRNPIRITGAQDPEGTLLCKEGAYRAVGKIAPGDLVEVGDVAGNIGTR